MEIRLPYQWSPRPYQRALWDYLRDGGTRAVVCAHRRWGKDDVSLHHTACAAHERVANYGHMLPKYEQGRKAIWDAVRPAKAGDPMSGKKRIDVAFPLEIRKRTNEQEMKIEFKNGSTWQVLGSDNYNSLMGTSYAGLVLSEDAQANPSAWGYFSPILRENGGWALFISTPRGRNHFHALLETAKTQPSWYWEVAAVDRTGALQQWELDEELAVSQGRYGMDYGYAIFRQEFFCSFDAAIPGSIWGDCVKAAEEGGRVLDFEINRTVPVDTGWDLGRTDDTAIWCYQLLGKQIDIFDHFAAAFMDIDNPVKPEKGLVQQLLRIKEQYGLTYGVHHLPHDARPRTLAAGGKSIYQQFVDAAKKYPGLGRFVIGKRLDKQEHIQAARATFPYCRFHKTRCAKGLDSLRQYHREYDDEKKCFRDTPDHDWASHDADGFMEVATSWKFAKPGQVESPLVDRLLAANPSTQTFGSLTKRHFDQRRRARQETMA